MKKISLYFLPLILFVSFLLGSRMILAGDFFYLYDQARDYLLVRNVVDFHEIMLIGNRSGLGGFFHGPLWIYILSPVYISGRGNPLGFAYFYIFIQMFTIVIAFIVGSKLYGYKGGLLISLLTSLSPVIFSTVPNMISPNLEPLVYLALFYFLIKFWRGDSKSYIFAIFFAGLSLQFETSSALVLMPAVVISYFFNKKAVKNLKLIFLSLISYILSLPTFILFDLRHNFLMTHALLGAFRGGPKGKGYLELGGRILAHLNSLLGVYRSVLLNQGKYLVVLFVIIIVFAFIAVLRNKSFKFKKEFMLLLAFPALMYVFFIFYPYMVWPEYVFGLVVPVILAFYLSISVVWRNNVGKFLIILFFSITFFGVFGSIYHQYLQKYQPNNTAGSYLNQKAVVDWIFKDAARGKFGYFVYTPEVFTHGMDYLFYWEAKNNLGKIPVNSKELTTYLILYPHLENDEGAYDYWKKNTIKTNGQIILTKIFNGGITVEKLLISKGEPEVDPNYFQGLLFR